MTSADPFVDNATLMRALHDSQARTLALTEFVVKTKFFEEIEANEMVKTKLVAFLQADQDIRNASVEYNALPWYVRRTPLYKSRRIHEKRLATLQDKVDQAFKELEMIRKLALPKNTLLMLRPYNHAS